MPTETTEAGLAAPAAPPVEASDNFLSQDQYRSMREGKKTAPSKPEPPAPPSDAPKPEQTKPEQTKAETTTDDSETTEDTKGEETPPKPKPKRDVNQRFSELTQEIKRLNSELSAAKNGGTGATETAAKPADDAEPKPEDYKDYLEWQKSWNRWDRRQDEKQRAQDAAKRSADESNRQRVTTWNGRVAEAQAKHADFEAVAQNPHLPVSPVMADAITDSELGTEILYHLGKNPAEAARIAKLTPVAQVRAIGVLEAKLTPAEAPAEDDTPQPKPVSQAPKPTKPLGSPSASSGVKNLEGVTQAEYRVLRENGKL